VSGTAQEIGNVGEGYGLGWEGKMLLFGDRMVHESRDGVDGDDGIARSRREEEEEDHDSDIEVADFGEPPVNGEREDGSSVDGEGLHAGAHGDVES
jgi:hypothetical protein